MVIDTKAAPEENKIESKEITSIMNSIKNVKELGGAQVFILVLNGTQLYLDSND